MTFKEIPAVTKKSATAWMKHDPFRQGAVIAYYAIFSLPGLLVIVVAVAGFIFGREAVTGKLSSQIGQLLGASTALQVQDMIAKASISDKSIWATVIAVGVLFVGATGVFAQIQKSLNLIWEVKAQPKKNGGHSFKLDLFPSASYYPSGFC